MSTLNSKLAYARRRLDLADENCPHWDYESDGEGHDCCVERADAKLAMNRARGQLRRQLSQRP